MSSTKPKTGITIEYQCHWVRDPFQMRRGRKKLIQGKAPMKATPPKPKQRIPTSIPPITKLLALAHYYQMLLNTGEAADYAEIAKLTGVSRARVTQIMNLTFLAPEIQQALLCEPLSGKKNTERSIRKIAEHLLWQEQISL